ncbi:hypothetical protein D3C76_1618750 [compost metagenome]
MTPIERLQVDGVCLQQGLQYPVDERLSGPVGRRWIGAVQHERIRRGQGGVHRGQPWQLYQQHLEQLLAHNLAQGGSAAEMQCSCAFEIERKGGGSGHA